MTPAEIQKIEAGVRILRDSLRPLGFDVELVCHARESTPDGKHIMPYACDVVEPYGFAPEAACPIHDPWEEKEAVE